MNSLLADWVESRELRWARYQLQMMPAPTEGDEGSEVPRRRENRGIRKSDSC